MPDTISGIPSIFYRRTHDAPLPIFPDRLFIKSVREVKWPANGCKALDAGDHHIVVSAGAVDDEQFSVCVSAANNTHMGIIWVKRQVAGLSVLPTDISTIAVLHGSSSAVANDVAAVCTAEC